MDNRKELKQMYKETEIPAGVYQIRNLNNQKVYVTSTANLRAAQNRLVFGFTGKSKSLENDWRKFGKDAFAFEILEILKIENEGYFDKNDELKKLEQKWLEKLQPFGDKGYN